MRSERERSEILNELGSRDQGSYLVLGIDTSGKITRVNEVLEEVTGKSKDAFIDIPFSAFLTKHSSVSERWMDFFVDAKDDKPVTNIELPMQTVKGKDVLISWTSFPIKNDLGKVSSLNLVGTPVLEQVSAKTDPSDKKEASNPIAKDEPKKQSDPSNKGIRKIKISIKSKKPQQQPVDGSHKTMETEDKSEKKRMIKIKRSPPTNKNKEEKKDEKSAEQPEKSTLQKPDTERKEKPEKKSKKLFKLPKHQEIQLPKQDNIDDTEKSKRKLFKKPKTIPAEPPTGEVTETQKQKKEKQQTTSKLPFKNIKIKKASQGTASGDLIKNLQSELKKLEKQNSELEHLNKRLETKLSAAEVKRNEIKSFFNERLRFLRDTVGITNKRKEFQEMLQQITEGKDKLTQLETDMILEKKEFKKKIDEFFSWREKLEQLEVEIEKRRQYILEQEEFLNKQFDKAIHQQLDISTKQIQELKTQLEDIEKPTEGPGIIEKDKLIDTVEVGTAILQRGRIRKANDAFVKMIGYTEKDVVGKHLVDFVGPTGLPGIEQHYLNRLKGVENTSYSTSFLTKNEEEIPVYVTVKNGNYQGERAEIVTFKEE
jgi:PAS domain S-box-containing protein